MGPRRLRVVGFMDDAIFQQCVEASQYLKSEYPAEYVVTVEEQLPFEFEEFRQGLLCNGKTLSDANARVVVEELDNGHVTTGSEFVQQLLADTNFRLFDLPESDPSSYHALAARNLRRSLKARGNAYCWMDISCNGERMGRLLFELFAQKLPRTCANFVHLCRGDLPDVVDDQKRTIKLGYKGTSVFRVVKGGWIQAGDVTPPHTGNGGYSCYGRYFPDESFDVAHDGKGILGMCKEGEDTNASSFYVTLNRSSWMNRSYVAFGRVVEGLGVLDKIAAVETRHNQSPLQPIVISDCGELSLDL